ncbi:hypothetical protein [Dyadobacter sp. LHD-138]|uniref:hypothetical protein n=1 Tax=Dyadobacter sp. LHD-138 TaxID=3071413 RepID=UPI0027E037D2|nr:hypothetical protein [Dyadobacter sp. LHD-138]MDQ6481771.1 hypothetical protein [Dyadobacter sp. LHD-138]
MAVAEVPVSVLGDGTFVNFTFEKGAVKCSSLVDYSRITPRSLHSLPGSIGG